VSEDETAGKELLAPFPLLHPLVERLEARRIRRSEGVREAICKRMDAHIEVRVDPEGMVQSERHVLQYAAPAHRPRTEEEELPGMRDAVKHMGHCMPQFFLRNIARHTMNADDPVDSETRNTTPVRIHEETLTEGRLETLKPHRFDPEAIDLSGKTLRLETERGRHLLRTEDWSRILGREIRVEIPGPIWKYFPEAQDLVRYGSEHSQVIERTLESPSEE